MALARLPRFIHLPGTNDSEKFTVRVQITKPAAISDDAMAEYDSTTRTVRIPKTADRARRLFLLDHELVHACADWRLWLQQRLGNKLAE